MTHLSEIVGDLKLRKQELFEATTLYQKRCWGLEPLFEAAVTIINQLEREALVYRRALERILDAPMTQGCPYHVNHQTSCAACIAHRTLESTTTTTTIEAILDNPTETCEHCGAEIQTDPLDDDYQPHIKIVRNPSDSKGVRWLGITEWQERYYCNIVCQATDNPGIQRLAQRRGEAP